MAGSSRPSAASVLAMRRRPVVLGVLLALGAFSMAVQAVQGPPQGPPAGGRQGGGRGPTFPPLSDPRPIKQNLYLVEGQGGNSVFFVMSNGVALVDTKIANQGQGLLDRIRTITDKPVTLLINTHTHGDHTGSNAFFGATIDRVVHENTKANMAKMEAFSGANAALLPNRTYTDRLSLNSGADRIDLYHFGPAHTNGDSLVVFPGARVMHGGDLFAWKQFPIIDTNNGGSGVQYGDTVDRAAKGIQNVDTVISGHSTVMTWSDFVEFGEFNREFVKAVDAARRAGRTAEQAAAELKLPAKFASYVTERPVVPGGDFLPTAARLRANVTALYAELSR